MVFTADLGTLYVAVPKTGCSTIKTILAASTGLLPGDVDPRRGWPQVHLAWRTRPGNWSSLAAADRAALLGGEGVFRFTSVRNPFERVVSCYLNKVARKGDSNVLARSMRRLGVDSMLSFLEAVAAQPPLRRDVHCRAMTDLCRPDRIVFGRIIRYEHFESDLRSVMEALGLGDRDIPQPRWRHRTDAGRHVAELIGPRERDLVREIYRDDFEAFGYSLEIPSP